MKISFEKKILLGFIINVLVVVAAGWIFISLLNKQRDLSLDSKLIWIELSLFVLSLILLTIVYFIIRAQLRAKAISQNLLSENKQLLQSIIDNTSNPIFIKKINGEYLLINKQYESLFQITNEEIIGKTDYDFLPKVTADVYRNSDLEVVKALRELQTEETIQQADGPHIYIAVKFPLYDSAGRVYAIGGISTDITERKKLEESLEEAGKLFNMSLDTMMVIFSKDKFVKINPAFTRILGYTLKDLESVSFLDLIHPDYVKIASERLALRLKGEDVDTHAIYPVLSKDGSYKWVESMITTDSKTGMMYVVSQDITKKRMDEEKLKIYTQKLKDDDQQIQTLYENAPDAVIVIDTESTIVKWNPKAESVFGWKATDVIGKPLYEFIIPAQHRESHKKGMESYLETGIGPVLNKSIEIEAVNKEGKEFPVLLSISPVKVDEKYLFIGSLRDITENKRVVNELYENEEKLRLIIENISEGVIVVNANKKTVMANEMAISFFGIKEDDEISPDLINHFEIYFPDEKTIFPSQNLPMERALKGESTDDIDVVLWDPAKQEKKRVLISGRPLVDQNNKVAAVVITIKDISKYKQLEKELKETESKYRQLIGYKKDDHLEI